MNLINYLTIWAKRTLIGAVGGGLLLALYAMIRSKTGELEELKYPWGDAWESGDHCWWHHTRTAERTCAVLDFPHGCSPYGLFQMAGNVWEWCADRYGASRILKGGTWNSSADTSMRCIHRETSHPTSRFDNYGFRCAATWPI